FRWLTKSFDPPATGKLLPGGWFRRPEFAAPAPRQISAKSLFLINFPRWHGLCRETGEPAAWESQRLTTDDGAAWESGARVACQRAASRLGRTRGSTAMENAALIGLSRQISLDRELEVVANNIANLNSTGYKADGSIFEEFLMPLTHG